MVSRRLSAVYVVLMMLQGCKSPKEPPAVADKTAPVSAPAAAEKPRIGLVLGLGGRGDQAFNDSALRGLELWAGGLKYVGTSYQEASAAERQESLGPELAQRQPPLAPLGITPVLLQSQVAEDYEPNLRLLVEQDVPLAMAVGFMLEGAVEVVAAKSPGTHFLLVDSPLINAKGEAYTLPNVRTVVYRSEEGCFLAGALAGLVAKEGKVGFVGGMEIPLVKQFEAGFRAGVAAVNPKATVVSSYTGSFTNFALGKQVGQDLVAKGMEVIFAAAGVDGLGAIQAVKEARDAGKPVYVMGVDSDQFHLAPKAMLTTVLKRVDLAVYEAVRDQLQGRFQGGSQTLGLKEGGVGLAPVRLDFPGKEEALRKVDELKAKIIAGEIQVPAMGN
ncbi:BMP family lipoprotein [Stigmatella erecta]|uniref:Nucleoside-binding protein n=1 Tax=Stigmatella erecta TaxID=83460 RepID=A0A1I0KC82_9BACT|nr:BMP family ABC transporter substrate-binding protein [Stigmatella erecta]SEU21826.1 nucleoside-binding protein [Stigmatella erecta]